MLTILLFQELLIGLRQWEAKANYAWDLATTVVPVHLRTTGITSPTPIRALANYETKEVCHSVICHILILNLLICIFQSIYFLFTYGTHTVCVCACVCVCVCVCVYVCVCV